MTKKEYLDELKKNIQSLDLEEQNEALKYYENYFDDAQDDQKVIEELGSPEELAKTIVEKFANAVAETEHRTDKYNRRAESKSENDEADNAYEYIDGLFYSFNKADIKQLCLKLGAVEVVAITGKDKLGIETRGIDKGNLVCKLTPNGCLTVKNEKRFNFDFFSHDRKKRLVPRILISIPEEFNLEKLSLHLGAGSFVAQDVKISVKDFSAEVGAGRLLLKSLKSESSEIRCGMGEIQIDGAMTGKTDVDCGMGSVKLNLRGKESDYSYDARVGLGDLKINAERKSGFCKVYDNAKKENHFSVNVGMGNVLIKIEE